MFTHLHLHTQYSLLEGAIKIPELTSALQQKGFDACAITDHGNMYGAMEFYHAMKKAGLKPLIGMGIFLLKQSRKRDVSVRRRDHPKLS